MPIYTNNNINKIMNKSKKNFMIKNKFKLGKCISQANILNNNYLNNIICLIRTQNTLLLNKKDIIFIVNKVNLYIFYIQFKNM